MNINRCEGERRAQCSCDFVVVVVEASLTPEEPENRAGILTPPPPPPSVCRETGCDPEAECSISVGLY